MAIELNKKKKDTRVLDRLRGLSHDDMQKMKLEIISEETSIDMAQRLYEEIDLYCMLAFRQPYYDKYNEWIRIAELEPKQNAIGFIYDPLREDFYSEIEFKMYVVLKYIVKQAGGVEDFYNFQVSAIMKRLKISMFNLY
jgi:hypothetical protein